MQTNSPRIFEPPGTHTVLAQPLPCYMPAGWARNCP